MSTNVAARQEDLLDKALAEKQRVRQEERANALRRIEAAQEKVLKFEEEKRELEQQAKDRIQLLEEEVRETQQQLLSRLKELSTQQENLAVHIKANEEEVARIDQITATDAPAVLSESEPSDEAEDIEVPVELPEQLVDPDYPHPPVERRVEQTTELDAVPAGVSRLETKRWFWILAILTAVFFGWIAYVIGFNAGSDASQDWVSTFWVIGAGCVGFAAGGWLGSILDESKQ